MKKLLLIPIIILSMVGLTYAYTDCAIVTPTASETISGSYLFSLTLGAWTGGNVSNCTYSTTGNIDFAINLTNGGAGSLNATNSSDITVDTATLTEEYQTTLTVTCKFTNGTSFTCTQTGIDIDNTYPVCNPLTIDRDIITPMQRVDYDIYCQSDTTDLTYYIGLLNPDGANATTKSTAEGFFENSDTETLGEYSVDGWVKDEEDHVTALTSATLYVSHEAQPDEEDEEDVWGIPITNRNLLVIGAVLLIVVGGVSSIFFLTGSKKSKYKRKRR